MHFVENVMKISLQLFFQFAYKLFYFYSFLLTVYQWFLHSFPFVQFADYIDILLVLHRLPLRYWLSLLHYWTSADISLQSSEPIPTQPTLLETSSATSQTCLEVSLYKRHLQSSCLLVILPLSFFLMTGVSFYCVNRITPFRKHRIKNASCIFIFCSSPQLSGGWSAW